jgi:Flp pilus assembly pilin Flp
MKQAFKRFINDTSGATAIEYGMICGLVGIVVALAGQSLVSAIYDVILLVVAAA